MKGIGASPGIEKGKVLVIKECQQMLAYSKIENTDAEISRFESAVNKSKTELVNLLAKVKKEIGEKEAAIFDAHIMILEDPELIGKVKNEIEKEKISAEYALKTTRDTYIEIFENMDNEYMRERAADIKDVTDRVIRNLTGIGKKDIATIEAKVVIAAKDLSPSDTAQMDKGKVIGILTDDGGPASHVAIMARALEVPAVVGLGNITEQLKTGDEVLMDGDEGYVFIKPDEDIIKKYMKKREVLRAIKTKYEDLKGRESRTKDGYKVELSANIGTPEELPAVLRNDGEGIGLFRTEFLYMDRNRLPSEEEQFEAYKYTAQKMKGKPVVIRTLDIGGDKAISYIPMSEEMNPFLGYRAIRLCLDRPDIFKMQLRALLRAGVYGNIKIMFPMISGIEELRKAKKFLNETKEDLSQSNQIFNPDMEVGMMIEVPAAAILSDVFAKEVDFFSIGTNDLIQYITAVDRGNKDIAHLYTQFHPALLRLIKQVIDNGHKEGIWVGMCGEAAGDPRLIPLLIGMGLDEFSMSPGNILKARWILSNLSKKEMGKKVENILKYASAEEVCEVLSFDTGGI